VCCLELLQILRSHRRTLVNTITGTAAFAAAGIVGVCRFQQAAAVAILYWPGVVKDACLDQWIVDKARPADDRLIRKHIVVINPSSSAAATVAGSYTSYTSNVIM
jgi:hypothetical protein